MNGVTRFQVLLGLTSGGSVTRRADFVLLSPSAQEYLASFAATAATSASAAKKHQGIMIDPASTIKQLSFDLAVPASSRLSQPLHFKKEKEAAGGLCAMPRGVVGGSWPTPQRGHWFPNDGDTTIFRYLFHFISTAYSTLRLTC
jgi:hypothetical protein